jgi:hypothetical protein
MDSQPRYAMVEKIIGRTGKESFKSQDPEEEFHKSKLRSWMTNLENS